LKKPARSRLRRRLELEPADSVLNMMKIGKNVEQRLAPLDTN
jgi:hypothetical protein